MDYDAQPESIFDHYQQGGVEEEDEEEEYEEGNQGEHEYYSELRRRNSGGGGGGGGGIGGDEVIGGGQMDSLDDSTIVAANDSKQQSVDDSSAGKLFVGGIAWETSTEKFSRYFGKFGEIADSVIMMDKQSGRPRGFGFVTFVDPEVANKVLEEEHVIDGRTVEVKRTVPRDENHGSGRGVSRTKKIFVGGIPVSLTEDDLKGYFSAYGDIVEYQIMLDHKSGRSRGFGFVTFDSEDSVEKIFSDGQMHELGGKRVEIKRAEPKRPGIDHASDNGTRRVPRGGGVEGGSSKPYAGYGGDRFAGGYGGDRFGGVNVGKMGRGYGDGGAFAGAYAGYDAYGNYAGGFGGGGAGMYGYGGYGYGFGFGGPMYGGGGGGGYGAGSYGAPGGYGGVNGYGMGRGGYGRGYDGKSYGGGGGGAGGGAGYGGGYSGNAGASNGRFHPYRR